jgi:thioesterase domain-containing protein
LSRLLPDWIRNAFAEIYTDKGQLLAAFDTKEVAVDLPRQLNTNQPTHLTWYEAGEDLNNWRVGNGANLQMVEPHSSLSNRS